MLLKGDVDQTRSGPGISLFPFIVVQDFHPLAACDTTYLCFCEHTLEKRALRKLIFMNTGKILVLLHCLI